MARSQKGFALLEVLVALGLFAITLAGLPALLISTIQGNVYARRITDATDLAQDKLEEIRNTPLANITAGTDQVNATRALVSGANTPGTLSYQRTWGLTAGPTGGTKQVTVTVAWTDRASYLIWVNAIVGG